MEPKKCAAFLVAGVIALGAAPAAASKQPPKTKLRSAGEALQRGVLGTYCWSYTSGGGGVSQCADAAGYSFPRAARVPAGATVRIRMLYPERPSEFGLSRWHEVDEDGQPEGDAKSMKRKLRRIQRDGETVAWDAVFKVRKPDKHYYLDAFVVWDAGDASYNFHVKTED